MYPTAEWLRLTFSDQSQTTLQEIGQFVNLSSLYLKFVWCNEIYKTFGLGSSFKKIMVSLLLNFTGFGATRP